MNAPNLTATEIAAAAAQHARWTRKTALGQPRRNYAIVDRDSDHRRYGNMVLIMGMEHGRYCTVGSVYYGPRHGGINKAAAIAIAEATIALIAATAKDTAHA